MDELESAVKSALSQLSFGLSTSGDCLCVGGGATELLLALYLRRRSLARAAPPALPPGLRGAHVWCLRRCVEHMAEALEHAGVAAFGAFAEAQSVSQWRSLVADLHQRHQPVIDRMLPSSSDQPPSSLSHKMHLFGCDAAVCEAGMLRPVRVATIVHNPHPSPEPIVSRAHVLDSWAAKRRAIELATDAAATALRIDGMITM